jgi:hypothetical protein
MVAQFDDLDLQDIQFLMDTHVREGAEDSVAAAIDEPTIVLPTSIRTDLVFPLINTLLPFEACLYHGLLPLYVSDDEFYLGMVNLEDNAALAYAKQILSYLKYHIIPQTIDSETHHQVLSAYLSYQSQSDLPRTEPLKLNPPPTEAALDATEHWDGDEMDDAAATIAFDLGQLSDAPAGIEPTGHATQSPPAADADDFDDEAPTIEIPKNSVSVRFSVAGLPIPGQALPELVLPKPEIADPRSLQPEEFLNVLLRRVLHSGIGRLFLAYEDGLGRVVWAENGECKTVLQRVPPHQLNGAIVALKQLMHLPTEALEAPIEAEIERLYQRQRVLLRLRITPKPTGEEATLQVLRGNALKFYQKHQLQHLSRDTKAIARQLQEKLDQLKSRTVSPPPVPEVVTELDSVIANLEQQLQQLKQVREELLKAR